MEVLIILLAIVVSVLNAILFFKVWGMTNNVKELKKNVCNGNVSREDIWLFVLNETHTDEEVGRFLSEKFLREGITLYKHYFTNGTGGDYALKYSSMRGFYQKMYDLRPNITPIEFFHLVSFNDFKEKIKNSYN